MLRLDPPRKFSFRPAEEWPEWSTEFKRFRTAGKLHQEDGEIQRDTLIYYMGQGAEKIYRTLQFDGEGETDTNFDCLMGKFTKYFIPKRNIIYERSQFQERKQRETETIEEFYRVLKDPVRHCNYGAEELLIIRDRFVVGLTDQKLKEKLQLIHDLTLKKALETARQHELIKSQMKAQAVVDLVSKNNSKASSNPKPRPGSSSNQRAACVKKKTSEPRRILLSITHLAEDKKTDADFKIDTGADVNIINKQTWLSLGKPQLLEGNINLSSPGGALEVKGKFEAEIKGVKTYICVIGNNVDNLLSRDTASALKLIKRVDQVKFNMVKCTPVKIKVKDDVTPYSISTARRVPIPLQSKVKKERERMKELDIIEEITEPTDWVSPMVPVPKTNGDVRICVDLRKLNQAVQREKYIIPMFDDIIHQLRGSTIFSKLDAQSGFWQLPLDPDTAKLTTFITPYGRFFMNRVPFGISSAPEIFIRTISEILQGIDGVICYFDDILCYSKTKRNMKISLRKFRED
ncbi:Pol polyprotein [Plakobranchus ocellatus]|uniref:Pol polyprotein n=1 Tax=Plakobranchus ocellatus TaxID=259542 RepID=A0AAV3ZUJ6_9GAST|nr:Pol polyprotein [Plakobranchus ocellatus]